MNKNNEGYIESITSNPLKIAKKFKRDGDEVLQRAGIENKIPRRINPRRWIYDTKIKRILLGVACEFYLKAAYSKNRFNIFKLKKLKEPIKITNLKCKIDKERTLEFQTMIDKIRLLFPKESNEEIKKIKEGLEIIRQWRNESAHMFFTIIKKSEKVNKIVHHSLTKIYELIFEL